MADGSHLARICGTRGESSSGGLLNFVVTLEHEGAEEAEVESGDGHGDGGGIWIEDGWVFEEGV